MLSSVLFSLDQFWPPLYKWVKGWRQTGSGYLCSEVAGYPLSGPHFGKNLNCQIWVHKGKRSREAALSLVMVYNLLPPTGRLTPALGAPGAGLSSVYSDTRRKVIIQGTKISNRNWQIVNWIKPPFYFGFVNLDLAWLDKIVDRVDDYPIDI